MRFAGLSQLAYNPLLHCLTPQTPHNQQRRKHAPWNIRSRRCRSQERARSAHVGRNARVPLWQASPDLCDQPEQSDQGHRVREPVAGRNRQEVVGRRVQQLGSSLESHVLLEQPVAERRRRADRRAGRRDQRQVGLFDKFKEEFAKSAVGTFGSGLGMAREEGGRLARHRVDEQRRHAADHRCESAADDRRVGTLTPSRRASGPASATPRPPCRAAPRDRAGRGRGCASAPPGSRRSAAS